MTTRAITLLLLSLAFNRAFCVPVPQCTGGSPAAPAPPEVYAQNNGQPVVLYAYNDAANELTGSAPIDAAAAPCAGSPALPPSALSPLPVPAVPAPAPAPAAIQAPSPLSLPLSIPAIPVSAPAPSVLPAPLVPGVPGTPDASDLDQAQALADQSLTDGSLGGETIPAPDQPCKVETSTEIVQQPGETFVHQPGEILISQPPTRLVINHAPYIVRPSPIILNQGGKTITNAYTRKFLPSQIQVRPVIVRIVKPIEKKVLIDKPGQPGSQSYVQNPTIPNACTDALALAPLGFPSAAAPAPGLALPAPGLGLDLSSLLASSGLASPGLVSPGLASPYPLGALTGLDASGLSPSPITAADQASLAQLLTAQSLGAADLSGAEIQSADGSILSSGVVAPSAGCGCA